jgi:PAS domain S-box-containing protein
MNWVTIIWSMVASACLTLALMHLLIWLKRRQAWASLWLFFSATGTCLLALDELWMMLSQTVAQYTSAIRWLHPPAFLAIVPLVAFVLVYLRAGRPWLAWTVFGVRTLSLVLNFTLTTNLNYRRITGLHQIHFVGDSLTVGEGVLSPWMLVGNLSFVLWIIFVADAAVSVWRRGDRRRAAIVGGSILFFALLASIDAVLAQWKIIDKPLMASFWFMGVIVSMAYELSYDSARAAQVGQELQESEHKLELAAEAAQLGFWIRDLATDQIWATEKWRSLFGFSDTEAVNVSLVMQRLHPNDRDDLSKAAISRALEESGSYEREYRVILPDNQMRWISSHGQVELDDRGKPARVRGVSRDVTQRRAAELDVLQQRQELAHLSRVTMLGELSGSIAHELNQPLGAILRNTEAAELFLQDPSPDLEEVRAILGDIRNDERRAGAVIDRMRSMFNRRVVEPILLDLSELVSEVISLVQRDADFRKVRLALRAASSLPPVRGDRVQLQQVLLNLLLNAMDAVSGSALDRRLVNVSVQIEGKSIEVAVSDTGHGIPVDKLACIFEQFFTTKPNGMGLGLPISRRIVEAHGGTIHGQNDPDGGATFYFTLPVAKGENAS